jgi:hypothetical protein
VRDRLVIEHPGELLPLVEREFAVRAARPG